MSPSKSVCNVIILPRAYTHQTFYRPVHVLLLWNQRHCSAALIQRRRCEVNSLRVLNALPIHPRHTKLS